MDQQTNPITVSLQQWAESAVTESTGFTSIPRYRVLIVLNAVLGRFGARYATITLSEALPEGIRILRFEFMGLWSPEEQRVVLEYVQSEDHEADPFLMAYGRHNFLEKPMAYRRQDLVSDDDWYESLHYKNFRAKADQDAAIYCTMPEEREGEATRVWSLYVGRRIEEPQFTEIERDSLFEIFLALRPLLKEVWTSANESLEVPLNALPERLKRVAVLVLDGQSTREIAEKLHLSLHTVQGYIKELYSIFAVNSRSQLVLKLVSGEAVQTHKKGRPESPCSPFNVGIPS